MMRAGEVVVIQYPFADSGQTKLRPALLLGKLPGRHDDWLVCMISSRSRQQITGFDDLIDMEDADFGQSGLKSTSVIRTGRLLVMEGKLFPGAIGSISMARLQRVRSQLAAWLLKV
jgi:mRNA interferase MazF